MVFVARSATVIPFWFLLVGVSKCKGYTHMGYMNRRRLYQMPNLSPLARCHSSGGKVSNCDSVAFGTRMAASNGDESDSEHTKQSHAPVIVRGNDDPELSDEIWEDVDTGQPPKWLVVKQLLGVNIFTYILAGAIAFFLTANYLLGPGWLGQTIGLQGTGTFTQVSDSLPDSVDLNDPNYFLD